MKLKKTVILIEASKHLADKDLLFKQYALDVKCLQTTKIDLKIDVYL